MLYVRIGFKSPIGNHEFNQPTKLGTGRNACMNQYIKRITVRGLHRTDSFPGSNFEILFEPGVNVVYGLNGSGKTTLMHILVNAVRFDFRKFITLFFEEISIEFSDGELLRITNTDRDSAMEISFHGLSLRTHEIRDLNVLRQIIIPTLPAREFLDLDAEHDEVYLANERRYAARQEIIRRIGTTVRDIAEAFRNNLSVTAEYFPAFRLMSEVIPTRDEETRMRRLRDSSRHQVPGSPRVMHRESLARIYGEFAPSLNYPSPEEIERRLRIEVQRVVANVARSNRETLSDLSFEVLKVSYGTIIGDDRDEINSLVSELQNTPIYPWLPEVATTYRRLNELNDSSDDDTQIAADTAELYRSSLDKILKEQVDQYAHIERFKNSVNEFLIGKDLVIAPGDDSNRTEIGIQRDGDESLIPMDTMSSGEKQIFSLLYAASFLGDASLVLIDEPEISLHVDWQYQFARTIAELLGPKQLIVCTHSPEVLTGFEEVEGCNSIELDPAPAKVYGRS